VIATNSMAQKKTTVNIKRVTSTQDLTQAFSVRMRVFVKEQKVPAEIELDRDDERAMHFLATLASGRAVGTARLVVKHGRAKIGRMAVLKSYRRMGIGKQLLKRAIAAAKRLRAQSIYLHAQVPVIGFYERLGFQSLGKTFDEAGIAHRKMILKETHRS